MRDVEPREAHDLMRRGSVYLDVRTVEEFEQGHPPGAFNIPAFVRGPRGMEPNPEFVGVVRRHFPEDVHFLVGCASGRRSSMACELLRAAGYTNLTNVVGGFGGVRDEQGHLITPGWRDEGLPVSTSDEGRDYASLRGA